MSRAIMKQALDALDPYKSTVTRAYTKVDAAIDALRTELAKPEPEPVGYVYTHNGLAQGALTNKAMIAGAPLYAAPTEPNCRFPVCHSQEYQEKLADEITKEQL